MVNSGHKINWSHLNFCEYFEYWYSNDIGIYDVNSLGGFPGFGHLVYRLFFGIFFSFLSLKVLIDQVRIHKLGYPVTSTEQMILLN